MYKIQEKHAGFTKPINLVWMEQVTAPVHKYHPAVGYHGRPGKITLTQKGFGSIEAALRWLNENTNPEPELCQVNGVKSQFSFWFESTN